MVPVKRRAFEKDADLSDKERFKVINTTQCYLNNDSLWSVALFKVFNEGTIRSPVILEEGGTGLLASYVEGGTTSGDSYLWKLFDNGFQINFQM